MWRSREIWPRRSEEIDRRCADCPISVLSISARLGPSQSSDLSGDALRRGKIASEIGGALGAADVSARRSWIRWRTNGVAIVATIARAAAIHLSDAGTPGRR